MSNKKFLSIQELEEQFFQECFTIETKKEYPGYTGNEKWIIATDLSESEFNLKYSVIIDAYKPYLLIKTSFVDVRSIYIRNNKKFKRRSERNEDIFGYIDSETEVHNKKLNINNCQESFLANIDKQLLNSAFKTLTPLQRERVFKKYYQGKSSRIIAKEDNVNYSTVDKSIYSAIKKMHEFLNQYTD